MLLTFPVCSATAYDWNGWSTNGVWTGLRNVSITAGVYCTTHQATFTNWTSATVCRTQTVNWIANVYASLTGAPNPIVSTWEFDVGTLTTAGVVRAVETRTFTNSLVATNLHLLNPDIMLIETWHALMERAQVIGVTPPASPRLPRYLLEDTTALKNWITNNCALFVNRGAYTNGTFTNWIGTGDWLHPPMIQTHEQLAAANGLPTNYFATTFARETVGLGVGMGRIVTTTWRIATSAAGIVTQSTVNACGQTVNVSGTNGQYVSAICTNGNIQAGFTSLDYGLARIQTPINFLSWTTSLTTYSSSEWRRVSGPHDTEYAQSTYSWTTAVNVAGLAWTNQTDEAGDLDPAKTWRYTDGNDELPRRNTAGFAVPISPGSTNILKSTSIANAWITGFHTVLTTNFSHEAELFMRLYPGVPSSDSPYGSATGTCHTVNLYGYSFSTNFQSVAVTNLNAASIDWPTIGDNTNTIPEWTDQPDAAGCNITTKGYAIDKAAWLIRWDVTGGFRFKGD